ncbi:MAG: c-type cytochrome [Myxococcales bacterium]|nr:c-type cytochrome [Myxococcales bacterium]
MGKPTDELLNHEYDGIREFDNPIPAWWNWLFIATVVFSAFYFYHYHLGSGQGVVATYLAEMEQYEKAAEEEARIAAATLSEDVLAAVMSDSTAVAEGKATFEAKCAACHGPGAEGLIGPNLTDDHWIIGDGSLLAIHKVVSEGVAAKGMPSWSKLMTPDELNKVVGFVGTLRNTNVPGKAPEGEKVRAEVSQNNL